jgi:hypothetical protein
MTPAYLFQATIAVALALVLAGFAAGIAIELIRRWYFLLEAAEAALRRYANRKVVIRAYYDAEKMRHVKYWEQPTPCLVELAKKGEVA